MLPLLNRPGASCRGSNPLSRATWVRDEVDCLESFLVQKGYFQPQDPLGLLSLMVR